MHNKKHLLKFADVLWGKFFLFYIQLFCSLNGKTILSAYAASQPEENDDISDIDVWSATVRKYGRFVNIQFNVRGTIKTTGKFITLYTLEEKYRPISSVFHNYITQNGTPMLFYITSSGELQVYAIRTITNDWIIRQCLTFICAS